MGQELYVLKIRYRLWAFLILGNVDEFGSKPGRVGSPAFNWEFLTYVYSLLGSWRLESSTSMLNGSPQCLRVWQGVAGCQLPLHLLQRPQLSSWLCHPLPSQGRQGLGPWKCGSPPTPASPGKWVPQSCPLKPTARSCPFYSSIVNAFSSSTVSCCYHLKACES